MFDVTDELIKECDIYRESLTTFKNELIANLNVGVSIDDANKTINKYLLREPDIKPGIDLAMYYSSIGVMYEYVNEDKKAIKYYEKSMEAFPTTAAKGLQVLLKVERKNKK